MALAALKVTPRSTNERFAASIKQTARALPEGELVKYEAALEAMATTRGPGSLLPPLTLTDFVRTREGRLRSFVWVGQDPDDCKLIEAPGRDSYGLLDTSMGLPMKRLMFLFGAGWHDAGANALLAVSKFSDCCSAKLSTLTNDEFQRDVKNFLSDMVKRALETDGELHVVGFGVCMNAILATADAGGKLRPAALSKCASSPHMYVDGKRQQHSWLTMTGGNVAAARGPGG